MADYTQTTFFTPKDTLTTGDPNKIILGAEIDPEFTNIATAIATKYDSADIADTAAAEAGTSDSVLMTPLRVTEWSDAGLGILGDIWDFAAPGADRLVGWDESGTVGALFEVTEGLEISGTKVRLVTTNDRNVDHAAVSVIAGQGLSGGGDITADRTLNVGGGTGITVGATQVALQHLGLESLTDPNDDRIFFWDDSTGASGWLDIGSDLSISGTTLDLASVIGSFSLTNADTTLSRKAAGTLAVENDAVFSHASSSYTSAKITFSTSAPSGGTNGDIWFEY